METVRWIVLLCLSMDERADWTRDTSTVGDCHRVPNKSHRRATKNHFYVRLSIEPINTHIHIHIQSDSSQTVTELFDNIAHTADRH